MRISDWSSDVCSSDLVEVDRWIVDRMARDQMIEAPRAVGAAAARKGRAQSDDARDLVRVLLGIFAGVDAAERPSNQRGGIAGAVDDPLDAGDRKSAV